MTRDEALARLDAKFRNLGRDVERARQAARQFVVPTDAPSTPKASGRLTIATRYSTGRPRT